MRGLSLPPVVCRMTNALCTLSVFVYLQWCQTHIVLCFCFVCVRLMFCVPSAASFSGLFIFDCPFGIIYPVLRIVDADSIKSQR